jgi:thiol-disulfide isomerase/thioredoxin
MRRIVLTLAALFSTSVVADDSAVPIRLERVGYTDLMGEVKGLKGNVVLVDVWGTFCSPCKEKFPHVVALHEKYAKQGLAVISVSVDLPEDADAARKFLMQQRAAFRNVQLTDKAEVWQAKWNVVGPPLLFLFDRDGRLVARWEGKSDPGEIARRVAALCEK